jgi:hypothetical protein
MATGAKSTQGVLLKASDMGGTPVFTAIAEVKNISGPSRQTNFEDATSYDSVAFNEFVPTLTDPGSVGFSIFYKTNATQQLLLSDQEANTLRNYQLYIPTSTPQTWSFAAYVETFELDFPTGGLMNANVSLKVAGAITRA